MTFAFLTLHTLHSRERHSFERPTSLQTHKEASGQFFFSTIYRNKIYLFLPLKHYKVRASCVRILKVRLSLSIRQVVYSPRLLYFFLSVCYFFSHHLRVMYLKKRTCRDTTNNQYYDATFRSSLLFPSL